MFEKLLKEYKEEIKNLDKIEKVIKTMEFSKKIDTLLTSEEKEKFTDEIIKTMDVKDVNKIKYVLDSTKK